MEIEVLTVASSADTENGLLNVKGAGWEFASPQMLPITIGGFVAGIATFSPGEIEKDPVLTITMGDDDDPDNPGFSASILIFGARTEPAPGVPIREPFAVPFRLPVFRPCVVTAKVSGGQKELGSFRFYVRDPIPDTPPAS